MKSCLLLSAVLLGICGLPTGSADQVPADGYAIGVLADIQYGDKPTQGRRHYRQSLDRLQDGIRILNQRQTRMTIQLGDLIDGHPDQPERTQTDLDRILKVWKGLQMPTYHVVGNHCMVAGRDLLQDRLNQVPFYYAFSPPGLDTWQFIVLDGNDAGYGILSQVQLDWLDHQLAEATRRGRRVILFNHFALLPEAAAHHRMQEPKPVLTRMDRHKNVVAYLAGHDHAGGYTQRRGVHHLTLHGMVESPQNNAFAVLTLYPDRIEIDGYGDEPDRVMNMRGVVPGM